MVETPKPSPRATPPSLGPHKKIVLTGALGPVGKQVLEKLRLLPYDVEVWHSPEAPLPNALPGIHVPIDLNQRVAIEHQLEGKYAIIHCARSRTLGSRERDQVYRQNLEHTGHLLTGARKAGVKHFIHMGSIFAVGSAPNGKDVDLAQDWNLLSLKAPLVQADRLAHLEVLRQGTLGLGITSVIAPFLVGPGITEGLTPLLKSLAAGRLPLLPRGDLTVIDPRDLAQGLIVCLEKGPRGTLLLGGRTLSWRALAAQLQPFTGKAVPPGLIPGRLLKGVGKLLERWKTGQALSIMGHRFTKTGQGPSDFYCRPSAESLGDWWHWTQAHNP